MTLTEAAGQVSQALAKFISEQGNEAAVCLTELHLYGLRIGPMLAGRVMREYGHVVAADLRLSATVRYDQATKHIILTPLS